MENFSILIGKYGEEGDCFLFKVLNNGDFFKKVDVVVLEVGDFIKVILSIFKCGLCYDFMVFFVCFVVMYQNDLLFLFKCYQIQLVWCVDCLQKGCYQEFYQCDVDVVGLGLLSYEVELVQIYDEVFGKFGVKIIICINNCKVLVGIVEVVGIFDQMVEMIVVIDKLDKIGLDGVVNELCQCEIGEIVIE